jgi:hypothetical protein
MTGAPRLTVVDSRASLRPIIRENKSRVFLYFLALIISTSEFHLASVTYVVRLSAIFYFLANLVQLLPCLLY